MTRSYLFRGATLKIERAKSHLRELERVVGEQTRRHPYQILCGFDQNAPRGFLAINVAETGFRARAALIIGDVVQNLRSALDHMTVALAAINGKSPARVYFPIADTAETLKADPYGKIKKLSPEARSMILALEPHKSGNLTLWGLNRLSVRDKHELLLPTLLLPGITRIAIGTPTGEVVLTGSDFQPHGDEFVQAYFPWDAPRDLALLNIKQNFEATPAIAFGNIEPFNAKLVIDTLTEVIDEVTEIVGQFAVHVWRR